MPASKKVTKARKPAKRVWFTKVRGSYLPASSAGWLSYVPFTAYLLFALYIGINNTQSLGLAVLYVVPNWVAAAVIMTWVAAAKS